nr:unnamed protein product [Callosobruchus analis]
MPQNKSDTVANVCVDLDIEVNMLFLNIRSLSCKLDELELQIGEKNYDILCLCEHWLTDQNIEQCNLNNFNISNYYCRKLTKGGGVMIYAKDNIVTKKISVIDSLSEEKHCEIVGVEIKDPNIIILCTYRSPNCQLNIFFDCFAKALDFLSSQDKPIFIYGDFNIDILADDQGSNEFLNLVNSYGYSFLNNLATRISKTYKNSCLDNCITKRKDFCTYSLWDTYMSDHMAISNKCKFNSRTTKNNITIISPFRPICEDNIAACVEYLKHIDWNGILTGDDVNILFNIFLEKLLLVLEECFPNKTKTVHVNNKNKKWFNKELKSYRDNLNFFTAFNRQNKNIDVSNIIYSLKKRRITSTLQKSYNNPCNITSSFIHNNSTIFLNPVDPMEVSSIIRSMSKSTSLDIFGLKSIKVFKMQKYAIRLISKKTQRESCRPLFRELQILPLPGLYIYQSLVFVKNHLNEYITNNSRHEYQTRHASPISIEDVYNLIVNSNKDLKEDIQQINKNLFDVRTELEKTNMKFKEIEKENTLLKNKVIALENKLKKFNIVIYGINDSEKNLADENGKTDNSLNRPKPVVVELQSFQTKQSILAASKKLPKGSGIFITRSSNNSAYIRNNKLYVNGDAYTYEELESSSDNESLEKTKQVNVTPAMPANSTKPESIKKRGEKRQCEDDLIQPSKADFKKAATSGGSPSTVNKQGPKLRSTYSRN